MLRIERFSEHVWLPPWVRHQHIARFEYAASISKDCRVIDIGCGDGTCARYIAAAGARRVDGFDVSSVAIEEARSGPASQNTRFYVADATSLPVAAESYDLAVSFETIEHVHDDVGYLSEVVRVLRRDGCFLCSTPNRAILNPGATIAHRPMNPFHVREYGLGEFESLLTQFFESVVISGQSFYAASYGRFLRRVGRAHSRTAARAHQLRKCFGWPFECVERHRPAHLTPGGEPEIFVAVCR